jgi:hypothetical protein
VAGNTKKKKLIDPESQDLENLLVNLGGGSLGNLRNHCVELTLATQTAVDKLSDKPAVSGIQTGSGQRSW